MKRLFSFLTAAVLVFSLSACGDKTVNNSSEEPSESSTETELRNIEVDSEEGAAVCNAVGAFLDTFISADFEKISEALHPDDAVYFNFESKEQKSLYELIFPKISYKFKFVSEKDGVYGVMATLTSPNMTDVYGTLITENIDKNIAGEESEGDAREINNNRMRELLTNSEISERVEDLYIYVEYIDGKYIPRCDAFLANELVGGAVEAQSEIVDTLGETISALSE